MHLLYPSDPIRTRRPDEFYATELEAVRDAGFSTSVFSLEEFQAGEFRATPAIPVNVRVLYRGWMMSADDYRSFVTAIESAGAQVFTDAKAYLSTHYLPNWYPLLADLTPETYIYPAHCNLETELRSLSWPEYFIKDFVKSLKTSVGSRISRADEVATLIGEMKRFRGTIEGGFCVRRVEEFLPETERRYFVADGRPYAARGEIPAIVSECAARLPSRFYSMDVVTRKDGELRIVEVGDGQVSDLVGWKAPRFAEMLATSLENS